MNTPATTATAENAPPPVAGRALVSPVADFWLMGGASLVAFVIFVIVTDVMHVNVGSSPIFWAYYLTFLFNDPHFTFSYFLFYKGFGQRLRARETEPLTKVRMIVAGFIVPGIMAAYFVFAILNGNPKLVDWAYSAMIFSVGWHYVKQGYGVLITMSLYDGILYSTWEKRILWLNGYAIWLFAWAFGTGHLVDELHYGVSNLSGHLARPFLGPFVVSAAVVAATLLRHAKRHGGNFSMNGVLGYCCAVYVWILMPFVNPLFYWFVPMFHALQYLPFVYKMKETEFLRDKKAAGISTTAVKRLVRRAVYFTAMALATAAFFFGILPRFLDDRVEQAHLGLHPYFFFLMFLAFINIHHFFMDSAYWRRDNARVQQDLFRA